MAQRYYKRPVRYDTRDPITEVFLESCALFNFVFLSTFSEDQSRKIQATSSAMARQAASQLGPISWSCRWSILGDIKHVVHRWESDSASEPVILCSKWVNFVGGVSKPLKTRTRIGENFEFTFCLMGYLCGRVRKPLLRLESYSDEYKIYRKAEEVDNDYP
jgi:hypothetical protein